MWVELVHTVFSLSCHGPDFVLCSFHGSHIYQKKQKSVKEKKKEVCFSVNTTMKFTHGVKADISDMSVDAVTRSGVFHCRTPGRWRRRTSGTKISSLYSLTSSWPCTSSAGTTQVQQHFIHVTVNVMVMCGAFKHNFIYGNCFTRYFKLLSYNSLFYSKF